MKKEKPIISSYSFILQYYSKHRKIFVLLGKQKLCYAFIQKYTIRIQNIFHPDSDILNLIVRIRIV